MKTLEPAVAAAIAQAIRELEARSCAEVVVEVRARSGSYGHADARFAALIAFVALLVLLFSPWTFAPMWVAIDVAVIYFLALIAARRIDGARRLMTTEGERARQARTIAASLFVERGVANTERETGVLVYHGVLERRIEVIADRGVLLAVPPLEWNEAVTGTDVVDVLRAMQPLLETHLPLRAGDRDELPSIARFAEE